MNSVPKRWHDRLIKALIGIITISAVCIVAEHKAEALPAEFIVGPRVAADGTTVTGGARAGNEGQVIVGELHGRFYEPAKRGQIFQCMTAVGGTTVVAANDSPVAAAAATVLSLYNPIGSGVNLEVDYAYVGYISGTTAAGGLVYNIGFNNTITATQNFGGTSGAGPQADNGTQSSVAKCFTQTALTGGGAQVLLRPVAGIVTFTGAVAASSVGLTVVDPIEGAIVLPPGGVLTLAAAGTGTSQIIQADFQFRQTGTL